MIRSFGDAETERLWKEERSRRFPGIYETLREQRSISADVALRLGKYFGVTPQFWMNLQTDYDLRLAAASAPLSKIKPRSTA